MFVVETNGVATECWWKQPNKTILEALEEQSCVRLCNLGFVVDQAKFPGRRYRLVQRRPRVPKPAQAGECLIRGADLLAESRYDEALCMFEESRRLGDSRAGAAIARCKAQAAEAGFPLV
jgi:hypothetical protein